MKVWEVFEQEETEYWNSLTKEQQLLAFCSVMRRVHEAEFDVGGTYRWVLYDKFGFGRDAYMRAQFAGFLDIHNACYEAATINRLDEMGIVPSEPTEEDILWAKQQYE